ncbi:MAG: DUF4149 domain-containing protein [Longimicrobiales bacterium]|nr:DUF4149 domain-containing protein [Longimicrobiales bacterium]
MRHFYLAAVSIHILAAIVWLGGIFFLGLVGAPTLRGVDPPALRARLFSEIGRRFRALGWGLIAVLLITGVAILALRGLLRVEVLTSSAFWGSAMGVALAWKLVAVTAMIGVSALHDFGFGPAATRLDPQSPEGARVRRIAVRLARVTGVLGVIVVLAAVRLARGG